MPERITGSRNAGTDHRNGTLSHPLIHKQGGKERKKKGARNQRETGREGDRKETVESRDPKGLGEFNRKVAQ
jgi:hypothetical protein